MQVMQGKFTTSPSPQSIPILHATEYFKFAHSFQAVCSAFNCFETARRVPENHRNDLNPKRSFLNPNMAPSVLPPPTKPLLSFKNDDLLVTALTAIATCEDFNLEDFLADRPSSTSTTSTTASSNGPTSLTSFTLFTKLFPELQLKIWAHAYANLKPRNLTIEPPLVKVPALLQTCFDSRKIGLEIYTRQEHAARPGIPAFISIIDFEKDSLNLTQRGEFENPQPENQKHNRYVYNESLNYIIINYDDNLLMYALHHYPELCKRIKRVAIRSCYISWLGKLEMYTDKLSIEGFFKKHFPTLERLGLWLRVWERMLIRLIGGLKMRLGGRLRKSGIRAYFPSWRERVSRDV
ncbi:hypothetical protein BKA61DRAFT_25790 [Leptodontidium sp. MPI-SDFR-AT-0119]|nr:hypothetical protein BKA61DRAFT_25790 [Leptodontidium sp. MPI-SDFR-AT-0119]